MTGVAYYPEIITYQISSTYTSFLLKFKIFRTNLIRIQARINNFGFGFGFGKGFGFSIKRIYCKVEDRHWPPHD